MNEEYSNLKIVKHLTQPVDNYGIKFIQIDLHNKCNYDCAHCSSKMYEDFSPSDSLNIDKLVEFLDYMKSCGVKAIEITGGGEPTLYKHLDILLSDKLKSDFEFAVVTNGSMLGNSRIFNLLEGATWIRLSIDAAGHDTYKKVHNCNIDIYNVLESASKFKKANPNSTTGFSFLILKSNYQEIYDAGRLAKEYGFDNIRYSAFYDRKGAPDMDDKLGAIKDLFLHAKELQSDSFSVFTFEERFSELYKLSRPRFCYYSKIVTALAANGNLYRCCALKNTSEGLIASIYKEGYKEKLSSLEFPDVALCPPCWMDEKNRTANYVTSDCPKHVNFI